jgi:hypothetical protein
MVANSFKVHGPGELVDLDRPIWQDQSPLVLGWSDGQLRGIAEAIGPRLTPQLTDSVLMTAASIARSVVIERLTRSRGVKVECDWQWPDGRYGNMTVHFYALAASSPQTGHTNVEASLAAYCSLEHANATPRPTLAAAQQLYEEIVEGAACVCGQCTADSFGAKAIHKLIDAYPDPIAVTDVEDYEEKDR